MFGRFKDSVRRLADVARGVPTIEQLVLRELEIHLQQEVALGKTSEGTLKLYRNAARHIIPRWGAKRPGEIDTNALSAEALTVKYRSQWNIWMALLGRVLSRAYDDKLLSSKPRLPRFRMRNREARVLPAEYPRVVETLYAMMDERGRAAHDPSSCRALLNCLYTGCRLSESRTLEWSGVFLDLRLIRCSVCKGQQSRYGLCLDAVALFESTPRVSVYCFPSRRDPQKPISRMHYTWAEVRRRVNLQQHVTIHGLRHSWATAAAAFGSLEQVRTAVGWSSEHMAARYSHLAIADVLPVIDRVGAVIGGHDDA